MGSRTQSQLPLVVEVVGTESSSYDPSSTSRVTESIVTPEEIRRLRNEHHSSGLPSDAQQSVLTEYARYLFHGKHCPGWILTPDKGSMKYWILELKDFGESDAAEDFSEALRKKKQESGGNTRASIEFTMTFPDRYPAARPAIRVVRPRMKPIRDLLAVSGVIIAPELAKPSFEDVDSFVDILNAIRQRFVDAVTPDLLDASSHLLTGRDYSLDEVLLDERQQFGTDEIVQEEIEFDENEANNHRRSASDLEHSQNSEGGRSNVIQRCGILRCHRLLANLASTPVEMQWTVPVSDFKHLHHGQLLKSAAINVGGIPVRLCASKLAVFGADTGGKDSASDAGTSSVNKSFEDESLEGKKGETPLPKTVLSNGDASVSSPAAEGYEYYLNIALELGEPARGDDSKSSPNYQRKLSYHIEFLAPPDQMKGSFGSLSSSGDMEPGTPNSSGRPPLLKAIASGILEREVIMTSADTSAVNTPVEAPLVDGNSIAFEITSGGIQAVTPAGMKLPIVTREVALAPPQVVPENVVLFDQLQNYIWDWKTKKQTERQSDTNQKQATLLDNILNNARRASIGGDASGTPPPTPDLGLGLTSNDCGGAIPPGSLILGMSPPMTLGVDDSSCLSEIQEDFVVISVSVNVQHSEMKLSKVMKESAKNAREVHGVVGLVNPRNANSGMLGSPATAISTCHLNAVVQSLFFLSYCRKAGFNLPKKSKPVSIELNRLFANLAQNDGPVSTAEFMSVAEFPDTPRTSGFSTELQINPTTYDARETFSYILGLSILKNTRDQNFFEMYLTIKDLQDMYDTGKVQLGKPPPGWAPQRAITDWTAANQQSDANKKTKWKQVLDTVLVIHIRRFTPEQGKKILRAQKVRDQFEVNEVSYTLHSIILHAGPDGKDSGHYSALIRLHLEQFYLFDDEAITPVSWHEVMAMASGGHWMCPTTAAYLMIYVKTESFTEATTYMKRAVGSGSQGGSNPGSAAAYLTYTTISEADENVKALAEQVAPASIRSFVEHAYMDRILQSLEPHIEEYIEDWGSGDLSLRIPILIILARESILLDPMTVGKLPDTKTGVTCGSLQEWLSLGKQEMKRCSETLVQHFLPSEFAQICARVPSFGFQGVSNAVRLPRDHYVLEFPVSAEEEKPLTTLLKDLPQLAADMKQAILSAILAFNVQMHTLVPKLRERQFENWEKQNKWQARDDAIVLEAAAQEFLSRRGNETFDDLLQFCVQGDDVSDETILATFLMILRGMPIAAEANKTRLSIFLVYVLNRVFEPPVWKRARDYFKSFSGLLRPEDQEMMLTTDVFVKLKKTSRTGLRARIGGFGAHEAMVEPDHRLASDGVAFDNGEETGLSIVHWLLAYWATPKSAFPTCNVVPILSQHPEVFKELITAKSNRGLTILHYIVAYKLDPEPILKMLGPAEAWLIDSSKPNSPTPLHIVTHAGEYSITRKLIHKWHDTSASASRTYKSASGAYVSAYDIVLVRWRRYQELKVKQNRAAAEESETDSESSDDDKFKDPKEKHVRFGHLPRPRKSQQHKKKGSDAEYDEDAERDRTTASLEQCKAVALEMETQATVVDASGPVAAPKCFISVAFMLLLTALCIADAFVLNRPSVTTRLGALEMRLSMCLSPYRNRPDLFYRDLLYWKYNDYPASNAAHGLIMDFMTNLYPNASTLHLNETEMLIFQDLNYTSFTVQRMHRRRRPQFVAAWRDLKEQIAIADVELRNSPSAVRNTTTRLMTVIRNESAFKPRLCTVPVTSYTMMRIDELSIGTFHTSYDPDHQYPWLDRAELSYPRAVYFGTKLFYTGLRGRSSAEFISSEMSLDWPVEQYFSDVRNTSVTRTYVVREYVHRAVPSATINTQHIWAVMSPFAGFALGGAALYSHPFPARSLVLFFAVLLSLSGLLVDGIEWEAFGPPAAHGFALGWVIAALIPCIAATLFHMSRCYRLYWQMQEQTALTPVTAASLGLELAFVFCEVVTITLSIIGCVLATSIISTKSEIISWKQAANFLRARTAAQLAIFLCPFPAAMSAHLCPTPTQLSLIYCAALAVALVLAILHITLGEVHWATVFTSVRPDAASTPALATSLAILIRAYRNRNTVSDETRQFIADKGGIHPAANSRESTAAQLAVVLSHSLLLGTVVIVLLPMLADIPGVERFSLQRAGDAIPSLWSSLFGTSPANAVAAQGVRGLG